MHQVIYDFHTHILSSLVLGMLISFVAKVASWGSKHIRASLLPHFEVTKIKFLKTYALLGDFRGTCVSFQKLKPNSKVGSRRGRLVEPRRLQRLADLRPLWSRHACNSHCVWQSATVVWCHRKYFLKLALHIWRLRQAHPPKSSKNLDGCFPLFFATNQLGMVVDRHGWPLECLCTRCKPSSARNF